MYFKKISGERIYLSPTCAEDAPIYTKWINDCRVSDGLGIPPGGTSLQSERELLENLQKDSLAFAIVMHEGDELIGNCAFSEVNYLHQIASVGLFIGEECNRHKGYGAETLGLLLEFGFKNLNLNNIMLRVFDFNRDAIACYEKVGFKTFGVRRNAHFVNGQYHNTVYMEIVRDEFFQRNSK